MWTETARQAPPEGVIVDTKIDNVAGVRNVGQLVFERNLWWFTDKSMYVYYTPTHWKIP